jgi:hypothetical protein
MAKEVRIKAEIKKYASNLHSQRLENVIKGIEEFEIKYPVVMDNDYKICKIRKPLLSSKYLIDKNGYFRYAHFGEGNYIETELAIQLFKRSTRCRSSASIAERYGHRVFTVTG